MKGLRTLNRLISVQAALKDLIFLEDGFSEISCVGGADLSYSGDSACCTVVVLDFESLELIEERTLRYKISFPYMPGFLSFREAEPSIKTFRALNQRPDVLIIDGQGIAHPWGIGLASHVGVSLDQPTIGVAKRPLVGEYLTPKEFGEAQEIRYGGRVVGYAYLSKKGTRPLIVSPGHRVSLESSLKIVKKCVKNHKLPEPLRLAHELSKKATLSEGSHPASRG